MTSNLTTLSIVALALAFLSLSSTSVVAENLIQNGSFEQLDRSFGVLEQWYNPNC